MDSRYDETDAAEFVARYGQKWGEAVALRVYTSRLLGADPSLVLHGGGNTSVKTTAHEITGEPVEVLYVKGSGWDLAAIEPEGYPACRLEPLRRLCELAELSDEDMVRGLRSQMLDPSSPTPSVEALLHAYLPARYVDHTHADAVLAVVDQADAAERVEEIWGEEAFFVPYVMPGFVLSRRIVELHEKVPGRHVMVLDKHGIFTWGETARESYERMTEAVSKAEAYVRDRAKPARASTATSTSTGDRRRMQAQLSPLIRGELARAPEGKRFMLQWRDDDDILALLGRDDAHEQTQIGTATPDHVIRTKGKPLWLGDVGAGTDEEIQKKVRHALDEYRTAYRAYFDAGSQARKRELTALDPLPRLAVLPGVGALALGNTAKDVRVAGDIYAHTARVILDALGVGAYRPVSELDLFDMEYWSLEQAKLGKKKAGGPLNQQIALVTGAASGIGRATAAHFLELGAHVVLCDKNEERLKKANEQLSGKYADRVAATAADVTSTVEVDAALEAAVLAFGGLDIVVSNAGNAPSGAIHSDAGDEALTRSIELNLLSHQKVARAASRVLLRQGLGGCLLFNASKSAFNPGPDFGPYAVPKAAVIALMKQYAIDLGAHSIRANAVNADRIHTDLFGGGLLEKRAKARDVTPEQYFRQNLLGRETTAHDVAAVFGWLANAEATTGCVVPVDGGNAAAFPR